MPDLTRINWTGLPRRSRQVAVFALVAALLLDALFLALDYAGHGIEGIAGGYYLVDFWDIAKALIVFAALLSVSQRGRSRAIRALAWVFLLLAIEDLITLHGFFGYALRAASGGLVPRPIGELMAFVGFGALVVALVWTGSPPRDETLRRARLIVSALLVGLFLFTGVVDFFADDTIPGIAPLTLVEESGERIVLTLAAAYAMGLAVTRTSIDAVPRDR